MITALLSYLPLKSALPQTHGNRLIAAQLPRALSELGYEVDYIDWRATPSRRDYDLVMGHGGYMFETLCRQNPDAVKIYFATGFYQPVFNELEERRFFELEQRRGVRLPYDRRITVSELEGLKLADGIICLGNKVVAESYAGYNVHPVGGIAVPHEWKKRGRDEGNRHFLFFQGDGAVHKGLDLLIEAFAGTGAHLHICQTYEREFNEVYKRELSLPNIRHYGNVPYGSALFLELCNLCNWTISASCSDSVGLSTLETMARGLIPFIPPTCGIDIKMGVTMDVMRIREQAEMLCDFPFQNINSQQAANYIRDECAPDVFRERVKKAIKKIV